MSLRAESTNLLERMPPFNPEMEEATIGCCVMDADVLRTVAEYLLPEHFFKDHNRTAYGAMLEMHRRCLPVDYVTFGGELRRLGIYEEVGGAQYIANLARVVGAINGIQYARCVLRLYVRREMIRYGARLAAMGNNDAEDATPELTAGIGRLTALRELWQRAHAGTHATPCGVLAW